MTTTPLQAVAAPTVDIFGDRKNVPNEVCQATALNLCPDRIVEMSRKIDDITRAPTGPPSATTTLAVLFSAIAVATAELPPRQRNWARTLRAGGPAVDVVLEGNRAPSESSMSRKRARIANLAVDDATLHELGDIEFAQFVKTLQAANATISNPRHPVDYMSRLLHLIGQYALEQSIPADLASDETGELVLSVDGCYFDGFTRPISTKRYAAGERASDPDAGPRIKADNYYFGFNAVVFTVKALKGPYAGQEIPVASTLINANETEAITTVPVLKRLLERGHKIRWVTFDRGFNSAQRHAAIRALGCDPIFHPKEGIGEVTVLDNGSVKIDGWLYTHLLPESARHDVDRETGEITPWKQPLPTETKRLEAWRQVCAIREQHAYKRNERPAPGASKLVLYHPAARGEIICQDSNQPSGNEANSKRRTPEYCGGGHPTEVNGKPAYCAVVTSRIGADIDPHTFQTLRFGSKEHAEIYKNRSSAERVNAKLVDPRMHGFTRGRFCFRGIEVLDLCLALTLAAINRRHPFTH